MNNIKNMIWEDVLVNKEISHTIGEFKIKLKDIKGKKNKIAAFDLDTTLIWTKSENRFAKNKNDWKLKYDTTKKLIEKYHKKGYKIVILSNQGGMPGKKNEQRRKDWKFKVSNVVKELNVPVVAFGCFTKDKFRKPCTGIWNDYIKSTNKHSFYCGDAAGRQKKVYKNKNVPPRDQNIKDHADTDYKFALNLGIKFYTPKEFFLDIHDKKNMTITYTNYVADAMGSDGEFENELYEDFKPSKKQEMIIMCGYPGSGKSYYVKNYIEPKGYVRINRDTLKTKAKCLKKCREEIAAGNSVVIDNTNPDEKSRNDYLVIAKKDKIKTRAIVFETDINLSKHNAQYRCVQSNGDIKPISSIVYNIFKKKYTIPSKEEGFDKIKKMNFELQGDPPEYFKYYH